MRHTNNTTQRNKNKFLRFVASAALLVILFVCVFAGVLSASFVVEEKAIENGIIDANVASADCFNDSYWNSGTGAGSTSGSTTTMPVVYASKTASLTGLNYSSSWDITDKGSVPERKPEKISAVTDTDLDLWNVLCSHVLWNPAVFKRKYGTIF